MSFTSFLKEIQLKDRFGVLSENKQSLPAKSFYLSTYIHWQRYFGRKFKLKSIKALQLSFDLDPVCDRVSWFYDFNGFSGFYMEGKDAGVIRKHTVSISENKTETFYIKSSFFKKTFIGAILTEDEFKSKLSNSCLKIG